MKQLTSKTLVFLLVSLTAAAAIPLADGRYELVAFVGSCTLAKERLCATVARKTQSERIFQLTSSPWDEELVRSRRFRLLLTGTVAGRELTLDAPPRVYRANMDGLFDDRNEIRLIR